MENKIKKTILIELSCFFLQIIFSNIKIGEINCVFSLPFAISRICYNGNIFCIIFSFIISKFHTFVFFSDLFICFYEVVVLTLYYFIKNLKLNNKPLVILNIFLTLSIALEFYYVLLLKSSLNLFFIVYLFKILLTLFFYQFFKIYNRKSLFFKFSNLDYLYFSIMSLFLSMGIYGFKPEILKIDFLIMAIVSIIACRIFPNDKILLVLAFGLGAELVSNNNLLLIITSIYCMLLTFVKEKNKYIYSLISIIPIIFIMLIKKEILNISLFYCILPSLFLICLPEKIIKNIRKLFEIDSLNLMYNNLIHERVFIIKNKLDLMAHTLKSMQKNFKFLLVGKINREKASKELAQDVISSCCKNCENYNICFFENINKKFMFESLVKKAIENGDINRDDLIIGLQTYCNKEGIIVSEINQISKAFLQFEKTMKTEDSSKLLISDELGNFADIFSNFSKMIKTELAINKIQSNLLKEYFINNMIDAKEVLIVENEFGIESVNLVAKNEDVLKKDVVDTISMFAKNKFKINSYKHLNYSGLSLASFIPCEKMKLNVAVASKAKEMKNGDSIAMCKLSQNKYFIAIADGMGHGEAANRISSMVLSLIKSMFEIGFDDELVVESINKLIISIASDNFTSLDAIIIDLDNEICTFIKLGASVSIIKQRHSSEIISCESLPIGIVGNIKPTIYRKHISVGDCIFLTSDGIVDSFLNIEEYKNYINDAKIYNLQKFIDDLLFDAEFQNKKHPDDMTIIAINLLKNY